VPVNIIRKTEAAELTQEIRRRVPGAASQETPMQERDDWGRDPQVRYMRRIFGNMEAAQKAFLERLGIVPFDERLRRMREAALHQMEQVWTMATRRGIAIQEDEFGSLYLHCFARLLQSRGLEMPPEALPVNEKIAKLLKEVGP
jgi:hypothetical protein